MNEYYSMHMSQICYAEGDTLGSNIGFEQYDSKLVQSVASSDRIASSKHLVTRTASTLSANDNTTTAVPQYIADLDKTVQDKLPPIMSRNASEIMEELLYDENFKKNYCMIAFAGHDLQILSPTGEVLSRCTADSLIDGVTHYTYSVFQQLLFCILENGALRVFCTRTPTCVLLREIYVGALTSDRASAMVLVEGMSLGPLRSSITSKDMRGDPSPLNINEAIVIGTFNGVLLCLDTFQELSLVLTQQISKSELECIKYRPFRNELVVVGRNSITSSKSTVRVFKVPDLILTHAFPCENVFTSLAVSSLENIVIVGNKQGSHQFFRLHDSPEEAPIEFNKRFNLELSDSGTTYGSFVEILHQDSDHSGAVTGISICDKLSAYATSAMDSSIKFWDFKKRCIKTILLDVPSRDVLFNWPVGCLLVTQRDLLQSVSLDAWKPDVQTSSDGEEENDWDVFDEEPQSVPPSAKPVSRQTDVSKPYSGVTFLTTQDEDEMAEVAFLEAALKANGNLDDYWKKHSSVGFGGKRNGRRRARSATNVRKDIGVKFDVRNPVVPVPPRRTKSNYFKRKSQKELEAQLAPPITPETSEFCNSTDESEDSDLETDIFEHESSDVDASALEDLVGRKEARGTATGRSLLVKTKSFMRKTSQSSRSPTPRGTMNAGASLSFFQTVQSAKSRPSVIGGCPGSESVSKFLEKQQELELAENGEVELFLKPNGPRGKKSFRRNRHNISESGGL
jgi:hypothetical protein